MFVICLNFNAKGKVLEPELILPDWFCASVLEESLVASSVGFTGWCASMVFFYAVASVSLAMTALGVALTVSLPSCVIYNSSVSAPQGLYAPASADRLPSWLRNDAIYR